MTRILLLLLGLSTLSQTCQAQSYQSLHSMQTLVKHFVDSQIKEKDFNYQLQKLDTRLKLPACPKSPEVFVPGGNRLQPGRNTVGIRCQSSKPWTIYTSVTLHVFKPVLVLTRPVMRGEIMTPQHLRLQRMDLGLLRQGYLDDTKAVINLQARRNLVAGTILTPRLLEKPDLVKRGEMVKIQAISPGFQISMTGVAMMNGKQGQRIRVKNLRSKRIIQAKVMQPGLVTVF